nr:hypothetical protein Q903MT_gene4619 [Picea sitchensis]
MTMHASHFVVMHDVRLVDWLKRERIYLCYYTIHGGLFMRCMLMCCLSLGFLGSFIKTFPLFLLFFRLLVGKG